MTLAPGRSYRRSYRWSLLRMGILPVLPVVLLLLSLSPCHVCGSSSGALNPFEKGCFYSKIPNWNHSLRVCNSEDDVDSVNCQPPAIDQLSELRIFAHNWESAIFESWILQIVLSEILGVPTTLETGTPNATINFYDPWNRFEYGTSNDTESLANALQLPEFDCTQRDTSKESYQSCSHFVAEVWDARNDLMQTFLRRGDIDPPASMGMLGQEAWFVPKFTARQDPSILSYLGLQGEENRRKLAQLFLTPTTWKDYCELISINNCTTPDDTASRAPATEEEKLQMFAQGYYTGHFRKTDKNDCDKFPHNCTGHLADYPCGWSSYSEAQIYHLGIPLSFVGEIPSYTYSQLVEMWHAANATKSNLIMQWWSPEKMFQTFQGTEAEFTRVMLPIPTQVCMDHRIWPEDRCSPDKKKRVGSPLGVCDDAAKPLAKIHLKGLYDIINDPSIPEGIRSPAYDVLELFQFSELLLAEIFQNWVQQNLSPRDALCSWLVDNMEYVAQLIPRTYPRVFEEESSQAISIVAISLGALVMGLVLITFLLVYQQRNRRVMKFAQIEFLVLLLIGSLMISIGAILMAKILPSKASCISAVWLINVGYTLELVPLMVKIAAINKLAQAAMRMQRLVLRPPQLFGAVALIFSLVVVFLITWTLVDPPREHHEYELTDRSDEMGNTIVSVGSYCKSESDVWKFVAVGWNGLLLLCATVLAVQTRPLRQAFNETQILGNLIYSHFVFVLLRLVTFFLSSSKVDQATLARIHSLIFSLDTLATLLIYFVPKFLANDNNNESTTVRRSNFSSRGMSVNGSGDLGFQQQSREFQFIRPNHQSADSNSNSRNSSNTPCMSNTQVRDGTDTTSSVKVAEYKGMGKLVQPNETNSHVIAGVLEIQPGDGSTVSEKETQSNETKQEDIEAEVGDDTEKDAGIIQQLRLALEEKEVIITSLQNEIEKLMGYKEEKED